ncbi:MAG TPA: hypothetical protein VKK31_13775 [Thermoanaerobaculia bacterium]|nr:hypothetical protein [Thermoanaerobaculia bacterium]
MSRNLSLHRAFAVFALLLALVFVSLPAQARPVRPTVSGASKVTVVGEAAFAWIRSFFAGLWSQGTTKEGMSIDPNGALSEEGTSIDPDGRT